MTILVNGRPSRFESKNFVRRNWRVRVINKFQHVSGRLINVGDQFHNERRTKNKRFQFRRRRQTIPEREKNKNKRFEFRRRYLYYFPPKSVSVLLGFEEGARFFFLMSSANFLWASKGRREN